MNTVARRVSFGPTPKFHNKPTETADGIKHPSIKEAKRWSDLNLLLKTGRIRNLERQVTFRITSNGALICRYIADFTYEEYQGGDWKPIVEDAKGYPTPVYRLKKKLMRILMGIEIRES